MNTAINPTIWFPSKKRLAAAFAVYFAGLLIGIAGLLNYFHVIEIAHNNNPQREDYYLYANMYFCVPMILVGFLCFLITPFWTRLKLCWKAVGSFVGVAVYLLLLKIVALLRISIIGVS